MLDQIFEETLEEVTNQNTTMASETDHPQVVESPVKVNIQCTTIWKQKSFLLHWIYHHYCTAWVVNWIWVTFYQGWRFGLCLMSLSLSLSDLKSESTTQLIKRNRKKAENDIWKFQFVVEGMLMTIVGLFGVCFNLASFIFYARQKCHRTFHRFVHIFAGL